MRRFTLLAITAAMLATLVVAVPGADAARSCRKTWGSLPETSSDTTTARLHRVRIGQHRCFDRIVLALEGGDSAGWFVRYVDEVTEDGSGRVVPVEGNAAIQIIVTAPSYDDDGNPTIGRRQVNRLDTDEFRTFRDVRWAGSFEGQTTIGLGVRARLPFRVFSIDGPDDTARVVIDVAHRW